jgi:hypothetical protein
MLEKRVLTVKRFLPANAVLARTAEIVRRHPASGREALPLAGIVRARAYMGDPTAPFDLIAADRVYRHVRMYLSGLRARLRKKGIRVHAHVLLGPMVAVIVDLAVREEPNLDLR